MENFKKKFKLIDEKLFPKLKNVNVENPQLIIVFSGVPGCGKTTLSKKIETKYKAVRINNDSIRKIIFDNSIETSEEETEELLQKYNFNLICNWPFKNKRIILDSSMDREYKLFLDVCKKNNFNYFIIRFVSTNLKECLGHLNKKEKISEETKKTMERWFREYSDFGQNIKADIFIDSHKYDLKDLFKELDKILL